MFPGSTSDSQSHFYGGLCHGLFIPQLLAENLAGGRFSLCSDFSLHGGRDELGAAVPGPLLLDSLLIHPLN